MSGRVLLFSASIHLVLWDEPHARVQKFAHRPPSSLAMMLSPFIFSFAGASSLPAFQLPSMAVPSILYKVFACGRRLHTFSRRSLRLLTAHISQIFSCGSSVFDQPASLPHSRDVPT